MAKIHEKHLKKHQFHLLKKFNIGVKSVVNIRQNEDCDDGIFWEIKKLKDYESDVRGL
jgi:hypothetical protein